MRKLYKELNGDRALVIEAYKLADERGEVRRSRDSNRTPSKEYAVRLWANGVYHGWLADERPQKTTSSAAISKSTKEEVELFEGPLRELGEKWLLDPSRPRPTEEALVHWTSLIDEWCSAVHMPLLLRKGGHRTLLLKLPSGRSFILCDNSPAHWAFMGCCAGQKPSLEEVQEQLTLGHVPIALARTRTEKGLIEAGTHEALGGFLASSKYGRVNKFTDGKAYKLCHLHPVGLGGRGDAEGFPEESLRKHMKLLLDPRNMIVVPLRYAGIGECEPFLRPFKEAL